jgi:hypothetical protein
MPRLLLLSYFVAGTLFYANVDCPLAIFVPALV